MPTVSYPKEPGPSSSDAASPALDQKNRFELLVGYANFPRTLSWQHDEARAIQTPSRFHHPGISDDIPSRTTWSPERGHFKEDGDP